MKKYDLENRFVAFAAKTTSLTRSFSNDFASQYYGNQLLRSGASAALNFGEAQGIRTNKDYIHKVSITLKELKETRVNFKILKHVQIGDLKLIEELLIEVEELI